MTWRNNLKYNNEMYHKCCIPTKKKIEPESNDEQTSRQIPMKEYSKKVDLIKKILIT